MQALAACQFGPWLVSFRSQELAEVQRCLDHERPRDALSGVEVKNERLRPIDIIDSSTPWVDLDDPDLHKAQQPIEAIDPQPGALVAPALAHPELVDGSRHRRERTLVEERNSIDVPHEG